MESPKTPAPITVTSTLANAPFPSPSLRRSPDLYLGYPMNGRQQAEIEWRDGAAPVSTRFADPYYSFQGGLAEARHVFLAGNDLPARFRPGFHIAELGFGTGLNLLTAWQAWRQSGATGRLKFTSFEAFPMRRTDIGRALGAFPELAAMAEPLLAVCEDPVPRIETGDLLARVIPGDARLTLPLWDDRADAWFLDGFAPARNPELWGPGLMGQVAVHTAPAGTFATYTAAGDVRRALNAAGFAVCRLPGFGTKRHMSAGRLDATR